MCQAERPEALVHEAPLLRDLRKHQETPPQQGAVPDLLFENVQASHPQEMRPFFVYAFGLMAITTFMVGCMMKHGKDRQFMFALCLYCLGFLNGYMSSLPH